MNPQLIAVAISAAPEIIGLFKSLFATANPDAPGLTDAEAIAGLSALVTSSLAIDQGWIVSHPNA
jgi:hypothetical protein